MIAAPVWAVIQGVVAAPIHCSPVPPPPSRQALGYGRREVPDGTTFGPLTYHEARACAGDLLGDKTLCVLPSGGLQAIHMDGLELERAIEAIGHLLPGMTFFLEDGTGILLIGSGAHFADLQTEGVTASCSPAIAFPIGNPWARPCRNQRGKNIRPGLDWKLPAVTTLEDLAPLAEYLRSLCLTEADRLTFRRAQEAEKVEDQREMQQTIDFCAKPQAQPNKRELLR